MPPRRGEVWLFDLGMTAKTRPVLIVSHLRDFKHGEKIPLLYARSYVHIDVLDVTGNFGHDINFLEWLELSRDNNAAGHIFRLGIGHRDGRDRGCVRLARFRVRVPGTGGRTDDQDARR